MNSLKNMAHWSGLGYLLIFISAFFATGFVVEALVVPGDPATTWANFQGQNALLNAAILSFILMVIIDAVLAVPFYILFKDVNRNLAMVSSVLRLVNASIFAVALMDLISFSRLLSKPHLSDHLFLMHQVEHLWQSFDDTWLLGLIFFGLHLIILGYLIMRSTKFPAWIGFLLQAAGLVYIIDSLASFSMSSYSDYSQVFELMVIIPSVAGELSFCLFLLIKGHYQTKNS